MSTGGASLPFPRGCKTDECVAMKCSQASPETSLAATVEIKKKVDEQNRRQTCTQFICASLKSRLPVISTVTDLAGVGVAYYTTGQKTEDRWTVILERVFASAKGYDAVPWICNAQHSARCALQQCRHHQPARELARARAHSAAYPRPKPHHRIAAAELADTGAAKRRLEVTDPAGSCWWSVFFHCWPHHHARAEWCLQAGTMWLIPRFSYGVESNSHLWISPQLLLAIHLAPVPP